MAVTIYVDGSGSPRGGFGWLVKETGESHYERHGDITNNQAEYLAVVSAMRHALAKSGMAPYDDGVVICSDSLNTVKQINHEYAINSPQLRELAMQAWSELARLEGKLDVEIKWVRRGENPAGKMLGS